MSKLSVTQASLAAMDEQLKAGTFNAGLLGQQDLAWLQQAVDATIAKVQALKDAAKAASDQFASLAQSVHDELLQQLGDQAALENERDQNTLAQVIARKQAGQVSDDQYQKALADEKQLHALKMADIAAQAAAQKSSSTSGGSGASGSGSGTDSGAGASGGGGGLNPRGQLPASPSAATQAATVTHNYYVTVDSPILPNTPAETDFARRMQKVFASIAARSR